MDPHTVLWRRLDLPGHEACRVTSLSEGWQISGAAVFADEERACRLDYVITCDALWQVYTRLEPNLYRYESVCNG